MPVSISGQALGRVSPSPTDPAGHRSHPPRVSGRVQDHRGTLNRRRRRRGIGYRTRSLSSRPPLTRPHSAARSARHLPVKVTAGARSRLRESAVPLIRRRVERWRRVIGHDGYLIVEPRLSTAAEGGRSRAVQSGYHAQWWRVNGDGERWLGSGPIDLVNCLSIKPGATGPIRIRPMDPSAWLDVQAETVLHLRERVGQTLGVATVVDRVGVPDAAPLRLGAVPLRPGEALLELVRPTLWTRLRDAPPPTVGAATWGDLPASVPLALLANCSRSASNWSSTTTSLSKSRSMRRSARRSAGSAGVAPSCSTCSMRPRTPAATRKSSSAESCSVTAGWSSATCTPAAAARCSAVLVDGSSMRQRPPPWLSPSVTAAGYVPSADPSPGWAEAGRSKAW